MKKPLDIIKRRAFYSALSGLMLAGLFLMAGCEAPSGTPGARPGAGVPGAGVPGAGRVASAKPGGGNPGVKTPKVGRPSGVPNATPQNPLQPKNPVVADPTKNPGDKTSKPPEGTPAVNPLAPTAKVEQAGNTVNLASEVIIAGANPFLNRLPKPVEAVDPSTTEGETATSTAPPPVDPFESVSLLGIAYHAKAPMALISVSGGESQTQMVRKGDVLMMDGGQVKVSNIGPESVEFEKLGPGGEKRLFNLPSIIGYGSTSSSSKSDGADDARGGKPDGMPGGAAPASFPGKSEGGSPSRSRGSQDKGSSLSNLGKISAGSPSGQSSGTGRGADVVLNEP